MAYKKWNVEIGKPAMFTYSITGIYNGWNINTAASVLFKDDAYQVFITRRNVAIVIKDSSLIFST